MKANALALKLTPKLTHSVSDPESPLSSLTPRLQQMTSEEHSHILDTNPEPILEANDPVKREMHPALPPTSIAPEDKNPTLCWDADVTNHV